MTSWLTSRLPHGRSSTGPGPSAWRYLRGQWWINHSRARAALDRLETVLAHGPGRIRPPNLLIVGPTNNGKTMVAEKFRRLHPATPSACGAREATPVVVMQMPAEPSLRRFYAGLLRALNAPVSVNVPGTRLEGQALTLLRAVEARVLVIDELHNLLAGTHARRAEFLNTLRFLGNELRIPIVGLGTKQVRIAVREPTTSWRTASSPRSCRPGRTTWSSPGSSRASRARCLCATPRASGPARSCGA